MIYTPKVVVLSAFLALALNHAEAFTPSSPQFQIKSSSHSLLNLSGEVSDVVGADVSIPYDAAARLEYDAWRKKFDKGDYDEARFSAFKSNYETITIANVVAAKEARESGSEAKKLNLNKYADMTVEEYTAMMSGSDESSSAPSTPKVDVLSKAFEATVSQSEAATALEEASAALDEEEEKLAKKLGLESVEELEAAIDAMDGIADDGGELDPDNVSREARIRSAYLDWCKEFDMENDEKRFQVFSENFLMMESYAKENGKELSLNKYADCTEEEYKAIISASETKAVEPELEPEPEMVVEEKVEPETEVVLEEEKKSEPEPEMVVEEKVEPEPEPVEKTATMSQPKLKMPSFKAPKLSFPSAPSVTFSSSNKKTPEDLAEENELVLKAREEAEAARVAREEEEKKAIEASRKEAKARQNAQQKEAEKAAATAEAEAIAQAKAIAEAEAAQVAKRRAIDEKAAEIVREQARIANMKIAELQKMQAAKPIIKKKAPAPAPKPEPVVAKEPVEPEIVSETTEVSEEPEAAIVEEETPSGKKTVTPGAFDFGSLFKKDPKAEEKAKAKKAAAEKAAAEKAAAEKAAAEKAAAEKAAAEKAAAEKAAAEKAAAEKAAAEKAAAEKAAAEKVAAKAEAEAKKKTSAPAFSFFSSTKPAPPTKSETAPAPAPKPVSDIDMGDPVTDAFASFFGTKNSAPVPEPEPTPAPTPKPVAKKAAPSFNFFSSSKPVPTPEPEPTPAPAPAPAPVAKKPSPAVFNFFTSSKPAPSAEPEKTPVPEPKKAAPSPFSFFSSSKPVPEPEPEPEPTPSPAPATFNFFGSAKPAASKPSGTMVVPPSKVKKAPSPSPSPFSLFGGPSKGTQSIPTPTPAKKTTPKATPFRAGGGTIVIPKSNKTKKVPAPAPVQKKPTPSPSFNFFGGAKKTNAPKTTGTKSISSAPAKAKKPVAKATPFRLGAGTFSINQKPKAAVKATTAKASIPKKVVQAKNDGIPVIKNFKKNPDGSITGKIFGSSNFRNGVQITTSPVRGAVKSGAVVTTSSGSKYKLQ